MSDFHSKINKDGPYYYKLPKIQCWDYASQLPFLEGNVVKYVTRHKNKGGFDDLKKAKMYIDKMIEIYYPKGDIENGR